MVTGLVGQACAAAQGAAASAGIPLTHRDHAAMLVFATGHLQGEEGERTVALDWAALARPRQTVVIYMGVGTLPTICTQLIAHGLPASTPLPEVLHHAAVRAFFQAEQAVLHRRREFTSAQAQGGRLVVKGVDDVALRTRQAVVKRQERGGFDNGHKGFLECHAGGKVCINGVIVKSFGKAHKKPVQRPPREG